MSFYTPGKCANIRACALALGMDADPRYWSSTPEELALIFNGCGPDSWKDGLRKAASWVYRTFPEAVSIHDLDFQFSDGTDEGLEKVNNRFLKNSQKKLEFVYPIATWKVWLYPLRSVAWAKMRVAFFALKNGAEKAWKEAHERLQEAK